MRRMLLASVAMLALAACDTDRVVDQNYSTNETVVNEDAQNDIDECPRADGQPCK